MAKQIINIGSAANDGSGDPLRSAFDKINDNFTEVYTELGGTTLSNISITGNTIGTDDTNGNIILSPNGTGDVVIATAKSLQLTDHTDNAILKTDATGNLTASALVENGSFLTYGDLTINPATSTIQTEAGTAATEDITLAPGGGEVIVDGHILSDTTNTKDLGSATNVWRGIFGTKLTATGDRINITTVHTPATAKGVDGDLIGDIAVDVDYIYYCTTTWTDGVADIWKRVAIATW